MLSMMIASSSSYLFLFEISHLLLLVVCTYIHACIATYIHHHHQANSNISSIQIYDVCCMCLFVFIFLQSSSSSSCMPVYRYACGHLLHAYLFSTSSCIYIFHSFIHTFVLSVFPSLLSSTIDKEYELLACLNYISLLTYLSNVKKREGMDGIYLVVCMYVCMYVRMYERCIYLHI